MAASLQRVPGVSIQRSGARGEPQGITVRGFAGDFNETLYDGRRISTANRRPESIPNRLDELLRLWRHAGPRFHDEFDRIEEVFPAASYQYVPYGMGFRTATDVGALSPQARQAQAAFLENQRQTQRLRAGLPRHRELIDKIMTHGLSAV